MPSYHNTNDLRGDELAEAEAKCQSQEARVLEFMKGKPDEEFTRDEIFKFVYEPDENLRHAPPSSAGRALTNLYKQNLITKNVDKRPGVLYGNRPQHLYKLIKSGEQVPLF